MQQISASVCVEDRFSLHPQYHGCNPSFVTTSEGIVMIDSPMWPTDANRWRNEISQRGEVRYIINTHQHIDHCAGNYFFPGIVISHEKVKETLAGPITRVIANADRVEDAVRTPGGLAEFIKRELKALDPSGASLVEDYQLRAPIITFSERLSLYLGDHTFELLHLPGHTSSHIGVYLPQEKVFFAGDNFTSGVQPALAHCLPLDWVESLKTIQAMDIDVIVPGHGRVCDKKLVGEFASFIQKCIDIVREAIKQGMSKEETVDKISFEELYPATHPGPKMQHNNVLRLYEMLSK
jgi:cyclase